MRNMFAIFAVLTLLFSCQKGINPPLPDNMSVTSDFVMNNSIILSQMDCAGDAATHTYVCFESVLNDSRCPEGAQCFWAGDAQVKFRFVKDNDNPVYFNLNTNTGFTSDTIIGGYKFTLKALNPYPTLQDINLPKAYKAEIEIAKETS